MTVTNNLIEKGTAVLTPGTKGADTAWGLCSNFQKAGEADKEQVKAGDGQTVGLLFTDVRTKYTMEFTPLAAAESTDPPKMEPDDLIGSKLTVNRPDGTTVDIVVESAEWGNSRGGLPTFKVEGYNYPGVSLT